MIRRNRFANSPSWFQDRFFTLHSTALARRLPSPVPPPGIPLRKCISGERAFSDVTHAHTYIRSPPPLPRTYVHVHTATHEQTGESGYTMKEACVPCRMCVGTSVAASIKLRFRGAGLIFCLVLYRQFFNDLFARSRIRLFLIFYRRASFSRLDGFSLSMREHSYDHEFHSPRYFRVYGWDVRKRSHLEEQELIYV